MNAFVLAIALVLVIEGAVYALAPAFMKQMMAELIKRPDEQLRMVGFGMATAGVGIIWAIDHWSR